MKGRSQSFADISCDIEVRFIEISLFFAVAEFTHRAVWNSCLTNLRSPSLSTLTSQHNSQHTSPRSKSCQSTSSRPPCPWTPAKSFSAGVLPYIRALVRKYKHAQQTGKFEGWDFEIAEAVERATVASGGRLIGKNTWLQDLVDKYRSSLSQTVPAPSAGLTIVGAPRPGQKKILMLGSGMVSGPVVDAICRRKDVHLTIGKRIKKFSFRTRNNLTFYKK